MRSLARVSALFILAAISAPQAHAQKIMLAPPDLVPSQVKYVGADAAIVAEARSRLERSFGKESLWLDLLDAKSETNEPVLIGQFLTDTFKQVPGFDASRFLPMKTTGKIGDVAVELVGIVARSVEQKRAIAPYLAAMTHLEPAPRLRRLTAAEMALIWPFIGWDLAEPLFVVETGGERIAIQFSPDGRRVHWMDRLSNICFKPAQNGKALMDCVCEMVQTDGATYEVMYRRQEEAKCDDQGKHDETESGHGP